MPQTKMHRGARIIKRVGWIVFACGFVSLSIYYGSTNEPIWPVDVMVVALLVIGVAYNAEHER